MHIALHCQGLEEDLNNAQFSTHVSKRTWKFNVRQDEHSMEPAPGKGVQRTGVSQPVQQILHSEESNISSPLDGVSHTSLTEDNITLGFKRVHKIPLQKCGAKNLLRLHTSLSDAHLALLPVALFPYVTQSSPGC